MSGMDGGGGSVAGERGSSAGNGGHGGGHAGSDATSGGETGGGCPLVAETFDINIPTVTVSGSITVNGDLPANSTPGVIRLLTASDRVTIASVADGAYSAEVIPGTYDVVYQLYDVPFPMLQNMHIDEPTTLDIDIPTAVVSGNVTVNGNPVTAWNAATITFETPDGGAAWADIRGGMYSLQLPLGIYDVVYWGDHEEESVPSNNATTILRGLTIDRNRTVDLDIPMLTVSATAWVDGGPLGTGFVDQKLFLVDDEGNEFPMLAEGGPYFTTRAIPGTYDIVFAEPDTGYLALSRNHRTLAHEDLMVDQPKEVDIVVPTVTISGKVTVNGDAAPLAYDATFVLVNDAGAWVTLATLSEPTYSARIIPGTYDLVYQGASGNFDGNADDGAPDNRQAILRRELVIEASATLDLDVPMVMITGQATLNGGPVETSGRAGFSLSTSDDYNWVLATTLSEYTAYTAEVMPGTYDVHYSGMLDSEGLLGGSVGLLEDVPLYSNQVLDLDLATRSISGAVTINGLPIPDDGSFRLLLGNPTDVLELWDVGSEYEALVAPRAYDIYFGIIDPTPGLPMNEWARVGCVQLQ